MPLYIISDGTTARDIEAKDRKAAWADVLGSLDVYGEGQTRSQVVKLSLRNRRESMSNGETRFVQVDPAPPCKGEWNQVAESMRADEGGIKWSEACDCGRGHTRTASTWMQDSSTGRLLPSTGYRYQLGE